MSLDLSPAALRAIGALIDAGNEKVLAAVGAYSAVPAGAPDFTVTSGPDEDAVVTIAAFDAIKGHGRLLTIETLKTPGLTEKQIATICANLGCKPDGTLVESTSPLFGDVHLRSSNGLAQGFVGRCTPVETDGRGGWQYQRNGYLPDVIGLRFEDLGVAFRCAKILAG